MNISKLLSSREREKILIEILFKEGEISVAEVSRSLGISKGFVSKFFSILAGAKIIKKSKHRYVVLDNIKVKSLRILFNLMIFADFSFGKYPFVVGAGIYGSCAKGENTEDSDIDIWVKIDKRDEEELARLTGSLKKLSGRISPLYLTREKLAVLKKDDPPFYNSIVHGSIKLCGENVV